jgi:2-polyprenyl-6-methoxyphenol hydroxylase-like FAD-dependent oxidoreductase
MTKNIAIIGAGPSGLLAAIYLRSHGMDVTLIGPEPKSIKGMVYALHPGNIARLHTLQIYLDSQPVTQMTLQPFSQELSIHAKQSKHSALCYIVTHQELLAKLKAKRRELDIPWAKSLPKSITPNTIKISTSGTTSEIKASHILACDGNKSWTRAQTPIPCSQHDYQQTAHTAIVTHTEKLRLAYQRFDNQGTLALLPTKNPHQSALILSCTEALHQEVTQNGLKAALTPLTSLGHIIDIQHQSATPLKLQLANSFHYGRIYLIGNAAHTIHPLAGVGFNLAISDIHTACEHILADLPASHYSLKRRFAHQKAHWVTHTIACNQHIDKVGALALVKLTTNALTLPSLQKKILSHVEQICLL